MVAPVPNAPRQSPTYTPATATTHFDVGFVIFSDQVDDLEVWHNGEIVTGWTLSATFPDGRSEDAQVVFDPGITGTLVILGGRHPRREQGFTEGVGIPPRDQNIALDVLTAGQRELFDRLPRTLLTRPGETIGPLPVTADRADAVLLFDAFGNPVPGPNADEIAQAESHAEAALGYRDEAEAFAAAAAATVNNGFLFDSVADLQIANVPPVLKFVQCAGFHVPGDCPIITLERITIPEVGGELLVDPSFDAADPAWLLDPDVSLVAGEAVYADNGVASRLRQIYDSDRQSTYRATMTISEITSSSIQIRFEGSAAFVSSPFFDTVATHEFIANAVDNTTISFRGANTFGGKLSAVSLRKVIPGQFQSADGAWWRMAIPADGVDIRQFGAKLDTGFDSTWALRDTIDMVTLRPGTRRVLVPASVGNFTSTANFSIRDTIDLRRFKRNVFELIGAAGAGVGPNPDACRLIYQGTNINGLFRFRGATGITLRGITLVCDTGPGILHLVQLRDETVPISFQTNRVDFDNVRLRNLDMDGVNSPDVLLDLHNASSCYFHRTTFAHGLFNVKLGRDDPDGVIGGVAGNMTFERCIFEGRMLYENAYRIDICDSVFPTAVGGQRGRISPTGIGKSQNWTFRNIFANAGENVTAFFTMGANGKGGIVAENIDVWLYNCIFDLTNGTGPVTLRHVAGEKNIPAGATAVKLGALYGADVIIDRSCDFSLFETKVADARTIRYALDGSGRMTRSFTLADDTFVSLRVPDQRMGSIVVETPAADSYFLGTWETLGAAYALHGRLLGSATVAAAGALTGETGEPGKFTVSLGNSPNNLIYIENRTGAERVVHAFLDLLGPHQ